MANEPNGVAARTALPRAGRLRHWWRPVVAVVGIVFATVFFFVSRQVLAIVEKPSWPPGSDAITAAGAQQAVAEFAARSDPRPSDVGMPYAWSTAATLEPWPEGRIFFPKILRDIEAARTSVHILMFGWREGEIGVQLSDLLIEKDRRGVEVRVIVDGQGSQVSGRPGRCSTACGRRCAVAVNDLLPWDKDGLYPDHRTLIRARTTSAGPITESST